MSSLDQYEIEFTWPSTAPKAVIVTGTFDRWSSSLRLNKTSTGFEARTRVPWGEKVKYKFIVDGEWRLRDDRPTEVDLGGYVNNVAVTPSKPAAVDPSVNDKLQPKVLNGNGNGHAAITPSKLEVDAPVGNGAAKPANGNDVKPHPGNDSEVAIGTGFLSDLANTIVARDGTSSALGYVASGLGAAMHSVVGVDPINIQKIAIQTPKADEMFKLPDGQDLVSSTTDLELESLALESVSYFPTSPVAPIVPIMIVPVNAPENNTIPRETFNPEIDSQVQIPVISAKVPALQVEAASEATPAIIDSIVPQQTPSKEQASSEPLVVNGPGESTSTMPISNTSVEDVSAPAPFVEVVEGAVLVEVKSSEEISPVAAPADVAYVAPIDAQVVRSTTSQDAEQRADAPVPVEATPVVDAPTPEADVATTKETPADVAVVPASEPETTNEEPAAKEATTNSTATSDTKTRPPGLPLIPAHQPSAPEPTTPTKNKFPSVSQQPSPSGSPASSKFGSTKRQKRSSILAKIKDIFHHDKEKLEKVKK